MTAVAGMLALACSGTVFGAQKKPYLSTYRWGTGGCEKGLYDQWGAWVGEQGLWAEDFMPKDAWNKIEGEEWQLGVWSKWRTFAPGRRLVLSVPMLVGPWNRSGPNCGTLSSMIAKMIIMKAMIRFLTLVNFLIFRLLYV